MKRCGVILVAAFVLAGCPSEPGDDAAPPSRSTPSDPAPTLAPRLERFVGRDASDAYFRMRELGYRVRVGPKITRPERMNVIGVRTHPEVDITEMASEGRVVTILDVKCYGGTVC